MIEGLQSIYIYTFQPMGYLMDQPMFGTKKRQKEWLGASEAY